MIRRIRLPLVVVTVDANYFREQTVVIGARCFLVHSLTKFLIDVLTVVVLAGKAKAKEPVFHSSTNSAHIYSFRTEVMTKQTVSTILHTVIQKMINLVVSCMIAIALRCGVTC